MARKEPHNSTCERCGGLLIVAFAEGSSVTLDATPVDEGGYRAWNRGDVWIAQRHDRWEHFAGMRRREHVCVVPDKQLEIGA